MLATRLARNLTHRAWDRRALDQNRVNRGYYPTGKGKGKGKGLERPKGDGRPGEFKGRCMRCEKVGHKAVLSSIQLEPASTYHLLLPVTAYAGNDAGRALTKVDEADVSSRLIRVKAQMPDEKSEPLKASVDE